MPGTAIAAGLCDLVLPLQEVACKLQELVS
jgi:hypothetical protein